MFLRTAYCLAAMLPVALSGCADSVSDAKPLKRFTDIVRGYDQTLTETEKKAAIAELKKDKERQEEQLEPADGASKSN